LATHLYAFELAAPMAEAKRTQAEPSYYDDLYRTQDSTYERPLSSPYYPLYRRVVGLVLTHDKRSVLEVGCGSGVLAKILIESGLSYCGFDFSAVAVQKAQILNPKGRFFVADATDAASYAFPHDAIVCCEVLEHIEADLDVIRLWPAGALCVCSVPNFDYESHVRFFRSEQEVHQRYDDLISIELIERIPTSARANLTWAEYFRRLRWARQQPKRVLGILGINTFSWYGGWFILVGRRC
jgi:SAM-dependent methyltransferase